MYCAKPDDQKFTNHFEAGVYSCSSCSTELFHAKAKYKHASAWPAFSQPVAENVIRKEVETEKQTSSDKPAFKLFCMKCDNILGHEFIGDGPDIGTIFDFLPDVCRTRTIWLMMCHTEKRLLVCY